MTTESATSSSSNNFSSSVQESLSVVVDSMEGYTNQSDNLEVDNGTFDNASSTKETLENVSEKSGINWTYLIIAIVLVAIAFYYFKKIKKEKEKLKTN